MPRSPIITIISKSLMQKSRVRRKSSTNSGPGRKTRRSGSGFARWASCREPEGVRRVTDGQCIDDLALLAQVEDPEAFVDRLEYLPL
jgi:hypothetical protein